MFFPGLEAFYQGASRPPASGTQGDEAYRLWSDAMKQYASETNSHGLPATKFWLILRVPKTGFSDKIEMHESIPMLIPKKGCGELVGVAREKPELDALIEPRDNLPDDSRGDYIYLTYRVRLQGQEAWRAFLEFAGKHNMLDPDV